MTKTSTSLTPDPLWTIDPARATSWRSWDGETVVYDDLSGDTLKLDVIMTVVFKRLLDRPATSSQLGSHLATSLALENEPKLHKLTELALDRLADAGLIKAEREPQRPVAGTPAQL